MDDPIFGKSLNTYEPRRLGFCAVAIYVLGHCTEHFLDIPPSVDIAAEAMLMIDDAAVNLQPTVDVAAEAMLMIHDASQNSEPNADNTVQDRQLPNDDANKIMPVADDTSTAW